MENTDSSLTTETTVESTLASLTEGAEQKVEQTSGTTAETTAKPAYDPTWWSKDDRATKRKMWKSEPDVVKSYFELEPQYNKVKGEYTNLQKQHDGLVSVFKEMGIDPTTERIKSALTELNTLKDPENLINKRNAFLSRWLDDPANLTRYGKPIEDFFTQLEEKRLLDDHPGLTKEQAIKQAELESKLTELEKFKNDQQLAKDTEVSTQRLNQGIVRSKQYAEKAGVPFTDDIKNKLIDDCIKNGIPTALVFERFVNLNAEALEKGLIAKANQEQLKNLNKNKGSVIPGAGPVKPADTSGRVSFKDAAKQALYGNSKT